jgi:dihydroflavonol-4-reductase
MSILVTGATGLVGNNVVRHLLRQGRAVRVLVREGADQRPLDGLAIERCYGDIRDAAAVSRAVAGVTAVIHSAAYLHIGRENHELQREINVRGTENVARSARLAKARLLHISTINALDVPADRVPLDETGHGSRNVPCGYVLTKQEAEAVVRREIADGLDGLIANPGFMLGEWDWKPSSSRMFIEVVRRRPLLAPRGGLSVCDIDDVTAALVQALDHSATGRQFILAGHNVTYLELWRRMAACAGSRPPLGKIGPVISWGAGLVGDALARLRGWESDLNSAAVRMSGLFHFYSSDRAKAELNYRPRPLEETIRRTYAWLVRQRYFSLP